MRHLRRHLSVANVLSCTALFMALSGVAYAAIGPGSVKTKNIATGAVTTPKLRSGAVTAAKVRNGAVIASKIAPGNVTAGALATGAVRSIALGGGVVTESKLKDASVGGEKLANNAVATAKIQNGAVNGAKLAPNLLAQFVKSVSYVTVPSASNDTEPTKTITAECPVGKQAIGGGAKAIGGGTTLVVITESAPTPVNPQGKRTGWTAVAREIATPPNAVWSVEAYVVCAEP